MFVYSPYVNINFLLVLHYLWLQKCYCTLGLGIQNRLKDLIKTQANNQNPKALQKMNKPANKLKIPTGKLFIVILKDI